MHCTHANCGMGANGMRSSTLTRPFLSFSATMMISDNTDNYVSSSSWAVRIDDDELT